MILLRAQAGGTSLIGLQWFTERGPKLKATIVGAKRRRMLRDDYYVVPLEPNSGVCFGEGRVDFLKHLSA